MKWPKPEVWIPSTLAFIALMISMRACSISWWSNQISKQSLHVSEQALAKRNELLVFGKTPTDACSLWSRRIALRVEIGLCWSVTITNESEDSVALQGFRLGYPDDPENLVPPVLHDIEYLDGKAISFPILLNAGQPLVVVIRAPFSITNAAEYGDSYRYLMRHEGGSLADFRAQLPGVDLVGNPVQNWHVDGTQVGWGYQISPKAFDRVTGIVTTTSGGNWSFTLSYPEDHVGIGPVDY